MSTPVDTSDKAYQASSEHPPDKADKWEFPAEEDGWIHSHNSIRMEVSALKDALTAVAERGAVADWEVEAIKEWWALHSEHIHGHHHNEDDIMNPFLRTRINLPDKLEADHKVLLAHMDKLSDAANALTEGGKAAVEKLQTLWHEYEGIMFPHLREEETVALPLLRAYFVPSEVGPVIKQIIDNAAMVEIGAMVECMGEEHFRTSFMNQEGIPFFVWWIAFRKQHAFYKEAMVARIDGLKSGTRPPAPHGGCVVS